MLGRKVGMTQIHDAAGEFVATTIVEILPNHVVRVKNKESDGYCAVQIAAEAVPEYRLTKPVVGHLRKNGCTPHRKLKEMRVADVAAYKNDKVFDLSLLSAGNLVDVSGIVKGRGFQGVMKRHGFSGGPASHGSMFHRRGGSYGQREEPGRIYRGRKMPGHMGAARRTAQNLEVLRVDVEQNLLFVRGSVVGCNGGLVAVRSAKKG
ncbi:MAG: 50S ribosomal protein L3 [Puniceicoccales bacterium]|nr:50S ribosomal protein L3 [Puniceicoccales bacterium]